MVYDNWKEVVADLRLDLMAATDKLRDKGLTTEPVIVDEDECECEHCNVTLEDDWRWCPGCGRYIDWDAAHNADDWYADEGERFLQAEVYEPLREAMR